MMKKIKYLILALLSISVALTSCKDPDEGSSFTIYTNLPAGQVLDANPDYSMWVEMLKKTDLYNAMNVATTYTCFVAKNSVVSAYLAEKGYASINEIDKSVLAEIIRYHIVVNRKIPAEAMFAGRLADTTATGDYLMTKLVNGNNILINDRSQIVVKNIDAINGVIHSLDKMLDPVVKTVWELVENDPNYSIFSEAAKKTGFDQLLNERYYYVTNEVSGATTRFKRKLTLFIIPDAIFAAKGINNFAQLIDLYGYGNTNYTDPTNGIYQFIGYHIIKGYNAYDDLTTFVVQPKTKNVSSFASSELIQINETAGDLTFNKIDTRQDPARLYGKYDVPAKNGIIHEIDGLLPIYAPPATVVDLELTDQIYYPEFASLSIYRVSGTTSRAEDLSMDKFPSIRWKVQNEGTGRIWYEIRSSGWTVMRNQDMLGADMGGLGWWEIDLPPIVKGRYNFIYRFHKAPQRGIYQMIFDGVAAGGPQTFANPSPTGYAGTDSTPFVVSFQESGAHTLRFSQVAQGIMEIDWIKFTPIN